MIGSCGIRDYVINRNRDVVFGVDARSSSRTGPHSIIIIYTHISNSLCQRHVANENPYPCEKQQSTSVDKTVLEELAIMI